MFELVFNWISQNSTRGLGALITIFSLFLFVSELRVYLKHKSSVEQLFLWSAGLVAGVLTLLFNDILLGALSGISFLMIYQVYELRDAPVWGKLMIASLVAYLTILGGKIAQMIFNYVTAAPREDERIFATAFIVSVYIFFIVAFIFFGKQFILVSRLSSPQMVYLFLFAVIYALVASQNFPNLYYLSFLNNGIADRILFASFGIYEILILAMTFMYFISGWLLDLLFGVKKVEDPLVLAKVKEVADKMNIKEELKVGFVQAPILNAFAYGPTFDKRISFIASDINQFSDSDIRGVVGHELAHATKNHTLILLFISIIEVAVKKLFLLPATYFDYSFKTSGLTISLFGYFILNYGLVIVLYIFVRALEGQADAVTKEVGYGEDLGKALFRLEGFYQGVASDYGISVNLLTNKQYTQAEREKFTAAAGRRIYQEFLSPTRGQALSNILVSHPRTSYRITALLRDDISPIKAAFLPYNILGLSRKKSIERIQSVREGAKKLLDTTFISDYSPTAIQDISKFTPLEEYYNSLVGKNVLAYDSLNEKVVEGVVERLELTESVSTPVSAVIKGDVYPIGDFDIKPYSEERFILKDGRTVVPEKYEIDKKDGLLITVAEGETTDKVNFADWGVQLSFFENLIGKPIFLYLNGSGVLSVLKKLDVEKGWKEGQITLENDNGEESFNLSDVVIDFKPMGIQFRREKTDEQIELLNAFIGKKISIYTKENYDVPLDGILRSVSKDEITIENRDGVQKFEMKMLEFVTFFENTFMLYQKDQLSVFDKFGLWWSNRNKFVNIR